MSKFDSKKYTRLLKDLEITELKFSALEEGIRIDAELYKKHLIKYHQIIRKLNHTTLGVEAEVIKKGIFDIKADCYTNEGVPFVRISNLKDMGIRTSDIMYIPEEENEKNQETYLRRNDIILSKTASAAASLVDIEHCNTSQDTVAIKLKSDSQLISHFVVVYLNTMIGKALMQRWFTGNIQMHLNLKDTKEKMLIPVFSHDFQIAIKKQFEKSIERKQRSEELYSEAENSLLKELGIKSWRRLGENIAVKTLSKSFGSSGRLDAEYYQPKFDELFTLLSKVKCESLGSLVSIKKSIEPGSEAYLPEGIPFVRIADMSRFGITQPDHHLDRSVYDLPDLKPKKDSILLTKDGTVGIAYKVEEDLDVITSSALLHLTITSDKVLPDYLTLVLNSCLTQMQAERDAGGSIIQHWRPEQIKKVVIPILPPDRQKQLVKQIKESFKLREAGRSLLGVARQAVETAIEHGE